MRYVTTLVFCFLLVSPHVHACRVLELGEDLFFKAIPDPQPQADVVAIISVSDMNIDKGGATVTAMAKVIQVLKAYGIRIKKGDKFAMKYPNTSCGPDPISGSEGMIIAKTTMDSKGRLVLHPYMRRYRGGIEPPAMLPDGFALDPNPLQIGEGVPENFAVILIGVTGADSVDYLSLGHSVYPRMSTTFPAQSNSIVAIAIPVGIKQLSIEQVTSGRRRAGYRPNDTFAMNTPKLDIDRPGLYYIATVDTTNPGQFQITPLPKQLQQFRTDYVNIVKKLKPVNFKWPTEHSGNR